jgi:hypothetical protein
MRIDALVARLEKDGLLLFTDAKRPNVASLVAGEPIRGSWWGHPRGKEIFSRQRELEAHADVLVVKLVDRKLTFVHRRLWPALLSVARAREPWQLENLSKLGRALLERVDSEGTLEAKGPAVKELQQRLLVHVEEVHTQSGAHASILRTWPTWASHHAPTAPLLPLPLAKQQLSEALARFNAL